jgi:hypothetical protein
MEGVLSPFLPTNHYFPPSPFYGEHAASMFPNDSALGIGIWDRFNVAISYCFASSLSYISLASLFSPQTTFLGSLQHYTQSTPSSPLPRLPKQVM